VRQLQSLIYDVLWAMTINILRTDANVNYIQSVSGNVPDFGRIFLKFKYTDITKNTYIRSWTFTEIMGREKCGLLAVLRIVPLFAWRITRTMRMSVLQSTFGSSAFTLRLHK